MEYIHELTAMKRDLCLSCCNESVEISTCALSIQTNSLDIAPENFEEESSEKFSQIVEEAKPKLRYYPYKKRGKPKKKKLTLRNLRFHRNPPKRDPNRKSLCHTLQDLNKDIKVLFPTK